MIYLEDKIPNYGRVVWCFRLVNGKRTARLAARLSNCPLTISNDPGANAWWRGINDDDGISWSDSTVEGWEEIVIKEPTAIFLSGAQS